MYLQGSGGRKQELLFIDDCIVQSCNLRCTYCRPEIINAISPQTSRDVRESVRAARAYVDAPILKLSGYGEISLLGDFVDILEEERRNFETVQVITNGTQLSEPVVEQIAAMGNVAVCLSLDGHTFEMNAGRVPSPQLHRRILETLSALGRHGVSLEVNSVLTTHNTAQFPEFLDFLAELDFPVTCYPFPVRQNHLYQREYRHLSATEEGVRVVGAILERYGDYGSVLPHKEYMVRLREHLQERHRVRPCVINTVNLGITPKADIVECACGLEASFGNLFTAPAQAFETRGRASAGMAAGSLPRGCQDCFTHYDVVNLYLEGTIALAEIARIPIFGKERTKKRLEELKGRVRGGVAEQGEMV